MSLELRFRPSGCCWPSRSGPRHDRPARLSRPGLPPDQLAKIARICAWREERKLNFRLEVNGGIDLATAAECHMAGADPFVVATFYFKAPDRVAFAAGIAGL